MNGFLSLCELFLSWSEEVFALAFAAGVLAGPLAAVVLAVNMFCRRWLSARQMGFLWGLVLLRLLLPVAPSSSLSLQNLPSFAESRQAEPSALIRPLDSYSDVPRYAKPLPAAGPYADASSPPPATRTFDVFSAVEGCLAILGQAWVFGAVAVSLGTMTAHLLFCRRLKSISPCEDPRLNALWDACRQQAGVRRIIPIVLTHHIEQPAVLGLFRTTLLLPEDTAGLGDRQLRMIMLHELAHVRRGHIAANWALLNHPVNPLVESGLLAGRREVPELARAVMRRVRHPANGREVLARIRRTSADAHPPATIAADMASHSAAHLSLVSSPPSSASAVRNRLKALPSAGMERSRWHAAAVAALVALTAVCGLTDASIPDPTPDHSFEWLPNAGHYWKNSAPADWLRQGPLETRTYDVGNALKRIAEDARSEEIARLELRSLAAHIAAGAEGRFDALVNDQQWVKESVSLDGTALTVKASPRAHAEIARNLAAWEQSGLAQICVETRFISGPEDIASALGISWRYLEAFSDEEDEEAPVRNNQGMPVVRAKAGVEDYLPIAVARLNEQQTRALLLAAQNNRVTNLLQAPKVTLINGQRATVLDQTQTPFVVGIQDSKSGAEDAKIAVIDEGIKLNLRTMLSTDAAQVQLEARIELSEIKGVGKVSAMFHGETTTIQIPRVKRCRIDVSSEIDDGQSLLIGCIPAYEEQKFFYVLMTARILELLPDQTD